MTNFYTFAPGVDTSFSSKLNTNFDSTFCRNGTINILNTIRSLQNGSIVFSKGQQDVFAEASIDKTGRLNSITSDCFSLYGTKIIPLLTTGSSGDTQIGSYASYLNSTSLDNLSYAFDSSNSTYAQYQNTTSSSGGDFSCYIGATFSARTVSSVFIDGDFMTQNTSSSGGGTYLLRLKLQTYNGSTWSDSSTLYNNASAVGSQVYSLNFLVPVNASVQGVRLLIEGGTGRPSCTTTQKIYQFLCGTGSNTEIVFTIPSGTFSSNISDTFASCLIGDWENGADIKYKLTSNNETSSWLNLGINPSIQNMTAFTSEPTSVTLKLIPKSSSPMSGYPSIYGFGLFEV